MGKKIQDGFLLFCLEYGGKGRLRNYAFFSFFFFFFISWFPGAKKCQHCSWIPIALGAVCVTVLLMQACVSVCMTVLNGSSIRRGTLWYETSSWSMLGSTRVQCRPKWTASPSPWTWSLEVSPSNQSFRALNVLGLFCALARKPSNVIIYIICWCLWCYVQTGLGNTHSTNTSNKKSM